MSAVVAVLAGTLMVSLLRGEGGDGPQVVAVPTAAPTSVATPVTGSPEPEPATSAPASTRPPSTTRPPSSRPPSSSRPPATRTTRDDDDDDGPKDPGASDPSRLAPGARAAYRQIETDMGRAGITLTLTSGRRSYEHQKRLWEEEVREKGSEAAARMRVLPPDESTHVHGTAIDIAPQAAQVWLMTYGKAYGWCRMYDNEPWHFEYSSSYRRGCPPRKPHP